MSNSIWSCFDNLKRDFCHRLRKASFVLEIIGVVIVGVYTCATLRSNRDANRRFEISQRPYVALGREDGVLMEFRTLKPEQQAVIAVYVRNAGNSPALNFAADGAIAAIGIEPHQLSDKPLVQADMLPGLR